MNSRPVHRPGSRASGIVLPTALIILLILSVAAVVLVEQISSQTRMAANSANMDTTLQAAEATLRSAVSQLLGNKYSEANFRSNSGGTYYFNAANYSASTPVPWQTTAGWNTAITDPTAFTAGDLTKSRKYMIEELPAVISPGGSSQKAYRITARVLGQDGQTVVMLQTLYKL